MIKYHRKGIILISLHTEHHQKKKITLCKIHKFFEKFNLPNGYFNGKEVVPNEDDF